MPYITETKMYLKFDAVPISDATGNTVSTFGGTTVITNGIFSKAYQMEANKRIQIDGAHSISTKLTMAFWLKPVNPGVISTVGGSLPLIMPVINKDTAWMIYESTQTDGTNKLTVSFNNGTYTMTSSAYSVDMWHHFAVVFNEIGPEAGLYVDGVLDDIITTGSLPASITVNADPVEINGSAPGSVSQVADNTALMDDFVVFNSVMTEDAIQRMANLGVLYVAFDTYADTEEICQTIMLDDPSTTQISSVCTSRGNLFVGKTNGQLTRGVRSLWESRKEFSDNRELEYTTIINKDSESSAVISDGKLVLGNQTIRI